MNVAIVDYGVGNIKSIQHSLDRIGVNHIYTMVPERGLRTLFLWEMRLSMCTKLFGLGLILIIYHGA